MAKKNIQLKSTFKGDGTFGKPKNGSLILKGKVPPLIDGTFKKKR